MKHKLVVIAETFYPISDALSVRLSSLVRTLQANGNNKVKIFTSRAKGRDKRSNHFVHNFIPRTNNKQSSISRAIREILYAIETCIRLTFSGRSDMVIITSPPFLMTCICCFWLRVLGKKYCIDVRDIYPDIYIEAGLLDNNSRFAKILKRIESSIYDNACVVFAATQELCNRIETRTKTRVELYRNGFDDDKFKPSTEVQDSFEVVFHGSMSKFQDIEGLIKLAEYLDKEGSDIKIFAIGVGSKDHLLTNANMPNLDYLGKLEYDDIGKTIAKAKVGVSLRTSGVIGETSFPVKLYEYIGVGLPSICTPHSEAGNFLEKKGFGYQFEPNDIASVAEKIIELRNDENKYQEIRAAIIHEREQYSRQTASLKVAEILEETIKQQSSQ